MTKKTIDAVTDQGAVELQEDSLDQASGGALGSFSAAQKVIGPGMIQPSVIKLADTHIKIVDGTSNVIKL